jgi:hypothetical protein
LLGRRKSNPPPPFDRSAGGNRPQGHRDVGRQQGDELSHTHHGRVSDHVVHLWRLQDSLRQNDGHVRLACAVEPFTKVECDSSPPHRLHHGIELATGPVEHLDLVARLKPQHSTEVT